MNSCKVTKLEVLEALEKSGGNVTQAAKLLDISPSTIYCFIAEHEDVEKKLYQIRLGNSFRICDMSESVIVRILQMVEDKPGYAFQAATFYLETHGRDRGYGPIQDASTKPPNDNEINLSLENMKLKHQLEETNEKLLAYESQTRQ